MSRLTISRADGLLSVQDMGRPGHLGQGLSCGGAMDRMALIEAAALLGADTPLAAIESRSDAISHLPRAGTAPVGVRSRQQNRADPIAR